MALVMLGSEPPMINELVVVSVGGVVVVVVVDAMVVVDGTVATNPVL